MNKRFVISVTALAALLFSAGVAAENKPAAPAPQQKLVKVATIRGAAAVREFEHNVQVLQAERQNAFNLENELKKETNAKKKKELQAKFDEAMAKLRQDNLTMAKTYGFSLTRNYTMEIEEANIYMAVSDAEAAQLEKENAEQADKATANGAKK